MKKEFKIFSRGIILNKKGEFLLVEKNKTRKIAPGIAVFPGGTIEFGETTEEALIRETLEEVGLEIISLKILTNQTLILDGTHWIGIYYLCKTKNLDFENKEPEKHTRVFWGNINDLDNIGREIIKFIK